MSAESAYHVLGERSREAYVVALLDEEADWEGILVGVTGREALVSHVEEGVVLARLDGIADLLPLLWGWVDTSGVVCAGVEEEDAALLRGLDVGDHTLEVEADGVLVVVSVLLNLKSRLGENGAVVCP